MPFGGGGGGGLTQGCAGTTTSSHLTPTMPPVVEKYGCKQCRMLELH